jgi:hypothetical protein
MRQLSAIEFNNQPIGHQESVIRRNDTDIDTGIAFNIDL